MVSQSPQDTVGRLSNDIIQKISEWLPRNLIHTSSLKKEGRLSGIIGKLVDDSLRSGDLYFEKQEEVASKKFTSKPKNEKEKIQV